MGGGLRLYAAARIDHATERVVKELKRLRIDPATPGGKAQTMENGRNGVAAKANVRNLLNRQHERKLEDFIWSQWERIESERPTKEAFAEQATVALGFKVSGGNVGGSCRAIERIWPMPKRTGDSGAGTKAARLRTMVAQIASMCRQRNMIATADFEALCGELGVEAPPRG
jgi:hypothetical protein